MDAVANVIDFFLHIDTHLANVIRDYGTWTYAILFVIIFLETGVVVTPFLPGDSLLFAAGAIAAVGSLDVWLLFVLLFCAAAFGDSVNYAIGRKLGPAVFSKNIRFLKREYLERTHKFYEQHGGSTIFLARFLPIIRTFAPFVAGVGTMRYGAFLWWNVSGALVWTALFTFTGYFFGNIPFVKENFEWVIVGIVFVSVLLAYLESRRHRKSEEGAA